MVVQWVKGDVSGAPGAKGDVLGAPGAKGQRVKLSSVNIEKIYV